MKSCTDIEQSKKLVKILSLESADMVWIAIEDDESFEGAYEALPKGCSLVAIDDNTTPCWSLAALLEEIPEIINFDDDESDYALEILKESGLYYLSYGNLLEHGKIEIEPQEYFVDACVAMIEKLHEQKLV